MGVVWTFFSLICPFSPLSPSLWETVRYRLKYCLKGPLNPKQPTNQHPERGRKKREMIGERKIYPNNPHPHLLQTQKALALPLFKLVERPGIKIFPSPNRKDLSTGTTTVEPIHIMAVSQLAMTREIIPKNRHHPTAARTAGSCPTQHNLPTRAQLKEEGKS